MGDDKAKTRLRHSMTSVPRFFLPFYKTILDIYEGSMDKKNIDKKFVSDLLVGHEVGHALYTPEDAVSRFHEKIPGAPFSIGNVVEDIRIERLVRDNYPGLIYSFREGYKHFIENDFFKLKNKDLKKFGFIDRLNLKGKIGNLMDIPLTPEEQVLYNRCLAASL
jgi:hypothetical protein